MRLAWRLGDIDPRCFLVELTSKMIAGELTSTINCERVNKGLQMELSASSEKSLADAFKTLFDFVASPTPGQRAIDAPVFTYLLTPKQKDEVDRICAARNWPIINCPGILIDINAIGHPVSTRRSKDNLSDDEIKLIIVKAFSPRSTIRANRDRGEQVLMLNTHQKIRIGNTTFHALAVLQICSEGARNYLAPVTCYHATEAKIRSIQ